MFHATLHKYYAYIFSKEYFRPVFNSVKVLYALLGLGAGGQIRGADLTCEDTNSNPIAKTSICM